LGDGELASGVPAFTVATLLGDGSGVIEVGVATDAVGRGAPHATQTAAASTVATVRHRIRATFLTSKTPAPSNGSAKGGHSRAHPRDFRPRFQALLATSNDSRTPASC
jgi:hypothetical protein